MRPDLYRSAELSHKKGSWRHCHFQDHHSLAAGSVRKLTTFQPKVYLAPQQLKAAKDVVEGQITAALISIAETSH